MNTLRDSPKYKSFVSDRNREIESINHNTQLDVSRILFTALERITGVVSHLGINGDFGTSHRKRVKDFFESIVKQCLQEIEPFIVARLIRMRKATFILTYISELEAVARATQRTSKITLHDFKTKIQKQTIQDTIFGQKLDARVWLQLTKLQSKIVTAFTTALVQEVTPKEVVDKVKKAYPQILAFKKPPRALKPLRESAADDDEEKKKEFDFYHDLLNDGDWDMAVNAYKDTELPPSRFDSSASMDPDAGYFKYNWELEQEMTDDFVDQVRDGQVAAATDLGVEDFVWVDVIDKKTCEECCLPRGGKLVSEIKAMLASGELDKEECDATVPPAHPYCRCDIAPAGSTDEVDGPDWKGFNEWVNS